MLSHDDLERVRGMHVVGPDDKVIGDVESVYMDVANNTPEFALINTGLFGTKSSFVPVDDAYIDGDQLRVNYSKDAVKDAPSVETEDELTPELEAQIYRYYGRPHATSTPASEVAEPEAGQEPTGPVGYDTSGPTTDEAMTRSEEELRITKTQHETGRARLRKWVDTEPVTTSVRTEHEQARIEREPITEENVDAATSGPAISEEEHEVPLHGEEAHVEKKVVPKERVRVVKDTVTEEEQVSEELRKERIEAEEEHNP
jgi:uncharacterized protein (TIGR02271 family)